MKSVKNYVSVFVPIAIFAFIIFMGIISCIKENSDAVKLAQMVQEQCGSDIVFSYDRFGALRERECYKVICYVHLEHVSYERIKCFNR